MGDIAMRTDLTQGELTRALVDPASVFASPSEVVGVTGIEQSQRIEILRRWEYDARELLVAEEESMAQAPPSDLLDRVLAALHQLGAHPELDNTPPTKQGGV